MRKYYEPKFPVSWWRGLRMGGWLILVGGTVGLACNLPKTRIAATRWEGIDSGRFHPESPTMVDPQRAILDASDDPMEKAPDLSLDRLLPESDSQVDRPTAEGTGVEACEEFNFNLSNALGTVLLVAERSDYMTIKTTSDCPACASYWDDFLDSLDPLFDPAFNTFEWGLKLYPSLRSTNACWVADGLEVAPGKNTRAQIQSYLQTASLSGNAPTTLALRSAIQYLEGITTSDVKSIVLATFGTPSCRAGVASQNDTDLATTLSEIKRATSLGILVFILGIGPMDANLAAMAKASGTFEAYEWNRSDWLRDDLEISALEKSRCRYPIGSQSVGLSSMSVTIDGEPVPRSAIDGWSLSPDGHEVILNGHYCDWVHDIMAWKMSVKVGCKE